MTVIFSFSINRIASSILHRRMYTIFDPEKNARINHERQPVTWKRGMESNTFFCGSFGVGKGGMGRPARSAALAGAEA